MGVSDRSRKATDLLAVIPDDRPNHLTNQFMREVILSQLNVVADAAARDALYPTANLQGDERVFNKTSGAQERYDPVVGAWVGDLGGAPAIVKADGQFISNGVMNGTTAVLTSVSNKFRPLDVGKLILVPGAGAAGALLTTTIASYQSAGQVTLAAPSQTAVAAASVTWGTDDTAAWALVHAGATPGQRVGIPLGYSLITDVFMGGITKSLALVGVGVSEIWGTEAQSGATSIPGVFPYIAGSVIVQCTAGKDGMQLLGTGITVHKRDFGIKFADGIAFKNTGHGIYAVPTAMVSGGHENGETGSREDALIVFGHDGNHYGRYSVNENLVASDHFKSYGGGVMYIECDSFLSSYGNSVYSAPYGSLFCGGSAHGYTLKSRTATFPGALNLIDFVRPQCNIQGPQFGSTAASVAQKLWETIGSPQYIGIYNPDLEGYSYANPMNFGGQTANVTLVGGLFGGGGAVTYPTQKQIARAEFNEMTLHSPSGGVGGVSGTAGDVVISRGGVSPGTGKLWFGSSNQGHYLFFSGTWYLFSVPIRQLRRDSQAPTEAVLVSGVDATSGDLIKQTITAARVIGAPLNPAVGQHLKFTFVQDGTGGWAITWNAVFKVNWADTGNTANKRSSIEFDYDGTNWNQCGAQAPYV